MHSFFKGFVLIYRDEYDLSLPFKALNLDTLEVSKWKGSVQDLLQNLKVSPNYSPQRLHWYKIHSFYQDGKKLDFKQGLKRAVHDYPELFI